MSSTFKILFYLRKNYLNKNGKSPIMVRITLNGEISQFSSKIDVEPHLWNCNLGRIIGKNKFANETNSQIDNIRASLMNCFRNISERECYVTVEKIRNDFLGYSIKDKSLLNLFKKHNEDVAKTIGITVSKATFQKYDVTYKRIENFMKVKYNISDIALQEIKYSFIKDFELYLRTDCNCSANTTAKFMQRLRRIVLIAKNNDWIISDPFLNYKIRIQPIDRGYLTNDEVNAIMTKKFVIERLNQVRDIFIFSCFTGLAYTDVKNLRKENICKGFDGNMWIMTHRQKTKTIVNVPLLKIPQEILNKYKDKLPNGMILPIVSNQKTNAYLKEIADICGINKRLTFHLARHTFATTTTLANGVPIETVSKMLGHTNIKTTQIYARITNSKISNDMKNLSGKLEKFTTIENI